MVMPWVIGLKRARELLYLGDPIDAPTALSYGMVNRVVPRAELHEATMKFAKRMAKMSPESLYATRYRAIMAASSSRPKPGPGETAIMPSTMAGRLIHIRCQTGSRSGSAKHSTQVPCGMAEIRCCAICGSS